MIVTCLVLCVVVGLQGNAVRRVGARNGRRGVGQACRATPTESGVMSDAYGRAVAAMALSGLSLGDCWWTSWTLLRRLSLQARTRAVVSGSSQRGARPSPTSPSAPLGWGEPILGLLYLVPISLAVWGVIDLRLAAESARRELLGILRDKECQIYREKAPNSGDLEAIQKAYQRIEEDRQGAFGGWLGSPLLGSLLLPVGGISVAGLVQWAFSTGLFWFPR